MIPSVGAIDTTLSATGAGAASGTAGATVGADVGTSFASLVSGAASRTVGVLEQAEQLSVAALQGKADMRQVVDAVMSAEQSLQAAVAIRDKIVSAYLDVSRMTI